MEKRNRKIWILWKTWKVYTTWNLVFTQERIWGYLWRKFRAGLEGRIFSEFLRNRLGGMWFFFIFFGKGELPKRFGIEKKGKCSMYVDGMRALFKGENSDRAWLWPMTLLALSGLVMCPFHVGGVNKRGDEEIEEEDCDSIKRGAKGSTKEAWLTRLERRINQQSLFYEWMRKNEEKLGFLGDKQGSNFSGEKCQRCADWLDL